MYAIDELPYACQVHSEGTITTFHPFTGKIYTQLTLKGESNTSRSQ